MARDQEKRDGEKDMPKSGETEERGTKQRGTKIAREGKEEGTELGPEDIRLRNGKKGSMLSNGYMERGQSKEMKKRERQEGRGMDRPVALGNGDGPRDGDQTNMTLPEIHKA